LCQQPCRTHAQQVQQVRRLVLHVRAAQLPGRHPRMADHGQVPQTSVHLLRAHSLRFSAGLTHTHTFEE